MKQLQIAEYGSASVLHVNEVPVPAPGPGEVLVRVLAAGVNFADVLRRRNTYFMPTPLPYVLGAEVVGEVAATGEGVTAPPFEAGSLILAILPYGGGYTEYAVAPAVYCVPLLPHIDPAAATALFVQGSTAHLILHETLGGDLAGKTILVHAASGGVGSLLVQLARLAGARVIAAASSEKKLDVARRLGAEICINYSQPGWTEALIAANGGEKVDIILEMAGGELYTQSFACLKTFGKMVVYGAASGEKGYIHSEHFVDESHCLIGFNLAHTIQHKTAQWQASLGAMIGLLAEGKIQVETGSRYSLSDAAKAHQDLENRITTGKIVLIP
ncbi:MAG: NADPH:quinone reductase [Bacteroidetes bacterium]|nr:MAG: NADPH:quinone reductase [Bacteroidota bacterium]